MIQVDIGMIFIVAVVNVAIGMLWYSPLMFGKHWAKVVGDKPPKDMGFIIAVTFVASLVAGFVLEIFISNIPGSNGFTGLIVGFWAGIGLTAAVTLPEYLFGRLLVYLAIDPASALVFLEEWLALLTPPL